MDKVIRVIYTKKSACGTWRATGAAVGVNPGTLHQIAAGRRRCSPAVRRALGLPAQTRLAATVTAEERDQLKALAAAWGLTWTQLCKKLAAKELRISE